FLCLTTAPKDVARSPACEIPTCLGHRRLPGSWSSPFFRRPERTRCRSQLFFCPFLRGLGRLGTRTKLCSFRRYCFAPFDPFHLQVYPTRRPGNARGVQRVTVERSWVFCPCWSPRFRRCCC